MYEFIINLKKEEYEKFVFNNRKSHFMQSYNWGEVQKEKNFKPYYIGLKKDNKLVATALILEKKILKNIGYLYCPRGFITDYRDFETIKVFISYLKKFIKNNHDIFLRIDPDLDIKENYDTIDMLKKLGFKHKGFNKNFENNQPRYTFRLNIDKKMEEIYKNFHPTTRKILNKGNQYDLEIKKGNMSDIDDFYLTMLETAKRENIVPSKKEYYKNFYQILNKEDNSDLYIVRVNIKKLKEKYNSLINEVHSEINKINKQEQKNAKKSNNTINDLKNKLNKMEKELEEINQIKEKELVLSSIISAKYKDKVWTVHGGNHNKLRWLNANYLLYYEIIKDANKDGYQIIDFFGTTGDPNPDNPIYGIHLFKQRLGGDYIEFIGEFDFVNMKILYFLYNKYINYKKKHRK